MRCHALLLLLALLFVLTPLHAGVLAGDTVNVTYYIPNLSTVFLNGGNITAPGSYNFFGDFTLQVNDTNLLVTFLTSGAWSSAAFNGWVLTDLTNSPITNVSVDGATTMAGFSASNLSFTANSVSVNWQGLNREVGGTVQLDLNAAVPEPATLALTGLALAALGLRRRLFVR